jgi:hypothetical protein
MLTFSFEGHPLFNPADDIDLIGIPQLIKVGRIQAPNLMQQQGEQYFITGRPRPLGEELHKPREEISYDYCKRGSNT